MTNGQPGQLRERVQLHALVQTPDGQGGYRQTWTQAASLWAAVRSKSVQVMLADGMIEAATRYEITLRYRTDVQEGMRLVWREKVLRITRAPDDGAARLYRVVEASEEQGIS